MRVTPHSRRLRLSVNQNHYIAMSRRLKLIVAYDGAPFAGWQSQSHRNTVQDHLERAFERVTGGAVRVHGAGRTDAGVHALAQCAHVDVLKFLASRPLDQSAQCATAFRHSRASLSICVAGFSRASFGKRKNLSLQNLDRAHFASIRVSPCLAHRAATRFKDFEISSKTFRRNS